LNVFCVKKINENISNPIPSKIKAVGPHKKKVEEQALNPTVFTLKSTATSIIINDVPALGKLERAKDNIVNVIALNTTER
jgi:hypothetical protein